MNEIVAIVFRIINFVVLIGLAIYLFRRYVLPGLRADYTKDKAFKYNLEEQKRVLEAHAYELDAQAAQQVIKGDYLQERIMQWHEAIEHKKDMRAVEKENRKSYLARVHRKQYEKIEYDALKQHVVPDALEKARALLKDEYQSPKGEQVFSDLIKHMQEKSL